MKNRLNYWFGCLPSQVRWQHRVYCQWSDGKLQLTVSCPSANGEVSYAVTYNGKQMLESSPLGDGDKCG